MNAIAPAAAAIPAQGVGTRAAKRGLDIVLALLALIVLAPLMLAIAAAVKLDSPGSVFYRCRRVGYLGRPLPMLKFRKMRDGATGSALTRDGDERFTRVGRVLAKTKLDELPQLFNVLAGDMSLVGPRPEDPQFVALYADAYADILSVRPGISGLSQLAFANESAVLGAGEATERYVEQLLPQKVALDRLYAADRTLAMDLRIIAWTVLAVGGRKDVAVDRRTARLTLRAPRVPRPLPVAPRPKRDRAVRIDRSSRPPRAVILAGGRGTRLAPYTSVLPKPLMPIGERSILEIVVKQLAASGVADITIAVGYLSHLIRAVFDNLDDVPANISYVQEVDALGTAGPLRLIEDLDDTFIAMNGDVLTTIDYSDLVSAHRRNGNVLTVAARKRTIRIDYGVLELDGALQTEHVRRLAAWTEKPELASFVSMGIYVIEPEALRYLPPSGPFDIPHLVEALLADGQQVAAYPFDGAWFDIGRPDDYEEAVAAWEAHQSAPVSEIRTRGGRRRAALSPAT